MKDYLLKFAVTLLVGIWLYFLGAPHWVFVACIGTSWLVKSNEL